MIDYFYIKICTCIFNFCGSAFLALYYCGGLVWNNIETIAAVYGEQTYFSL